MPRYINPQPQYFTDLGLPLTGGRLFFYEPSTLVPKATYSNPALSIPNTNPIVLATNGSPSVDIWLNGVYRVRLVDATGNVIWDKDPVGGDSSDRLAYQGWVAGISYNIGDIVTGANDRYYVSIVEPNLNNNPVSSPVQWTEIRLLRMYNANETYTANAIVQDTSGFMWRALSTTAGSTPALGSAFWAPVCNLSIYQLMNFVLVNANTTATVNGGPYYVTGNYTITLPASAGLAVGTRITVAKAITATATVQKGTGAANLKMGVFGATYTDVDFEIDMNFSFDFTFNGTDWEVN